MTPFEFKAWFDGFTASDATYPSLEKRAVINDRVADIDGFALTQEGFADMARESHCVLPSIKAYTDQKGSFDGEAAMEELGLAQALSCVGRSTA
jgi:hypothetical protein